MSDVSLKDFVTQGGGRMAFIFHVAGMPFAFCNSQDLIDSLPTGSSSTVVQNIRRHMFGNGKLSISGSDYYPADDVKLLLNLSDDLGNQTFDYGEGKGLKIGNWGVTISDSMQGFSFDEFSSTPLGLPGIRWLVDPIVDSDVITAELTATYTGSKLELNNSWGDLHDYLTTNKANNKPSYLWTGSSCIGVSDNATIGPLADKDFDISTTTNGLFQTPDETLFNSKDITQPRVQVSTIPADGIVGMPSYLWGIMLDNDGYFLSLNDDPILFRYGKVTSNPSGEPGKWRINCSGLTDLFKKKIKFRNPSFKLTGYTFSTLDTSSVGHQSGQATYHCTVSEYDGSTLKHTIKVNLAPVATSKRYETREEAIKYLITQLNADTGRYYNYQYNADRGGITIANFATASTSTDPSVLIRGIAPAVLQIGYQYNIPKNIAMIRQQANAIVQRWLIHYAASAGGRGFFWNLWAEKAISDVTSSGLNPNTIPASVNSEYVMDKNILGSRYLYQCDYADYSFVKGLSFFPQPATLPADKTTPDIPCWQVPKDASGGNRKLYFGKDTDTRELAVGSLIVLGDDQKTPITNDSYTSLTDLELVTRRLVGQVASVDTTSGEWITLAKPSDTKYSQYGTDIMSDIYYADSSGTNTSVARYGLNLVDFPSRLPWTTSLWSTDDEDSDDSLSDQWSFHQGDSLVTGEVDKFFRGLLGEDITGLPVPTYLAVTDVPFVRDTDSICLFDWDKLKKVAKTIGGATFSLTPPKGSDSSSQNGDKTVLQLLNNALFTLGARMIYEYSEDQRAWWISFEPLPDPSKSYAYSQNRHIEQDNIIPAKPSYKIGNDWMYSSIDHQCELLDGTLFKSKVLSALRKDQNVSNAKVLKLEDTITQIPNNNIVKEELFERLTRSMLAFAKPGYTQNLSTTLKHLTDIRTGSNLLLTWDQGINITTGAYGIARKPVSVTKETISLGQRPQINITVRIADTQTLGISPSLDIDSPNHGLVGFTLSLSNMIFTNYADVTAGLTDLAYFGCYYYNESIGEVKKRGCSCGNYGVIMVEKDAETYYTSGTSQNVYHGTIGGINLSAHSAQVYIDNTSNMTAYSSSKDYVLFFEARDNGYLQPCQTDQYGWLGDKDSRVIDSSGVKTPAIAWR